MNTLPAGWRTDNLGNIAISIRNGIFARRPSDEPGGIPILRISAVKGGRLDLTARKYVDGIEAETVAKFSIDPGDLLLTRYNGSRDLVGRCALVPKHAGPLLHPDKLIRVVLRPDVIDSRFAALYLESQSVRSFLEPRIKTTAGQSGIAGGDVRSIPFSFPDISEQRRIVDILEDHLSRLDAAEAGLIRSTRRLSALREAFLREALTGANLPGPREHRLPPEVGVDDGAFPLLPNGWQWLRLADVADVVGGVTKDSKRQDDPAFVEVPYLRVANVQRGHLRLDYVATIRVAPSKAAALRLKPGDVLLNEGGDRDKLARGWIWEGQIDDCIHQNHVFRARVRDDRIDPRLLSWAANTLGAPWAEHNGKQTTNLASISLSKIRLMPLPIPPRDMQTGLVQQISDQLAGIDRLTKQVTSSLARSEALRKSLLDAAFTGRLTGLACDVDMVEELAGV